MNNEYAEAGELKTYDEVVADKQFWVDRYKALCKALGIHWLNDDWGGAVVLGPLEIEAIEVYADGSVHLLGDHAQGVMRRVLESIVTRAKAKA